jgi:hypothetical protein
MQKQKRKNDKESQNGTISSLAEFNRLYFPDAPDAGISLVTNPYEFGAETARQSLTIITELSEKGRKRKQ